MTIHTCQFVNASDLFKGLADLWKEFANSDPDFSWGGNNRTLVDPTSIINPLDSSTIEAESQMEVLRHRVGEVPDGVYVDLEN